jgi:hypothetical protein
MTDANSKRKEKHSDFSGIVAILTGKDTTDLPTNITQREKAEVRLSFFLLFLLFLYLLLSLIYVINACLIIIGRIQNVLQPAATGGAPIVRLGHGVGLARRHGMLFLLLFIHLSTI